MSYKSIAQYKEMLQVRPTREIETLAETYNSFEKLSPQDAIIKDLVNAEMESRIMEWENQ